MFLTIVLLAVFVLFAIVMSLRGTVQLMRRRLDDVRRELNVVSNELLRLKQSVDAESAAQSEAEEPAEPMPETGADTGPVTAIEPEPEPEPAGEPVGETEPEAEPPAAEPAMAAKVAASEKVASEEIAAAQDAATSAGVSVGATEGEEEKEVPAAPLPATPPIRPVRPPRKPFLKPGWEQRLASRWLVWLGGIAMALGGLFLIMYAAEQGWFSPALRCLAGVALGAGFAVAGEWVRRRPSELATAMAGGTYVPQALTAAGLFIAFVSVYLAYALYELISPAMAFGLLGAVALAGFGLSLLQGPFVAALGLAGAMLTPALIQSTEPLVLGLFGYLLVITAASIAVTRFRDWWWLAICTIVFDLLWFLIWIVFSVSAGDQWVLTTFAGALAAGYIWLAWSRPSPEPFSFQSEKVILGAEGSAILASVGALGCFVLLTDAFGYSQTGFTNLALATSGLIAVAFVLTRLSVLTLAASVILTGFFVLWPVGAPLHTFQFVADMFSIRPLFPVPQSDLREFSDYAVWAAVFAAIVGLGGYAGTRRACHWALAALPSALFPLALLLIGYGKFSSLVSATNFAVTALALAAVLAGAYVLRRAEDDREVRISTGQIYACASAMAVTAAIFFGLTDAALTVTLAVQVLILAAIPQVARLWLVRRYTLVLATGVLIRLTFNPFLVDYSATAWLGPQWILYGFGLTAVLFFAAAQLFKRYKDDELVAALESGALVFAVLLVTMEIRVLVAGSVTARRYDLLEQSVQSLSWLTSAYGLMRRHKITARFYTLWGPRVLLALAVGNVFFFQLLASNPAFVGSIITGYPGFSVLALAYLLPAVLLWFIADKLSVIGWQKLHQVVTVGAMVLLFAFVTLEMRHIFQGAIIELRHDSLLELYLTTLVWAVLGAALVLLPAFRSDKVIRSGGLAICGIAATMVLVGHAFFYNPVATGEPAPGAPIFNVLLLGFLLPAALLIVVAQFADRFGIARYREYLGGSAYLIGLIYVTMELRRWFHGPFMHDDFISDGEYYGYSAIWLAYALATLAVGIWRKRAVIRYAALGVLLLTVLKVFLWDMAGLGGLYRVASFMGLGLCLVGIGFIYQRFVYPAGTQDTEQAAAESGGNPA